MDEELKPKQDELRARIQELIGDVETVGTLRRLSSGSQCRIWGLWRCDCHRPGDELRVDAGCSQIQVCTFLHTLGCIGDHETRRPSPRFNQCSGTPQSAARYARPRGNETRPLGRTDRRNLAGWREARDGEEKERLQRLIATGGGPLWSRIGPGEKAARLSDAWNLLTGREPASDSRYDDVEDWIFESSVRSLKRPQVKAVRTWRDTAVAHQDMRQTRAGSAGYDVFPVWPLVRAYWAVMTAVHRVLLLAEGTGLHGLFPTAQFSVTEELSGGALDPATVEAIDERLALHSVKWDRLLRQSEQRWYLELNETRQRQHGKG